MSTKGGRSERQQRKWETDSLPKGFVRYVMV
jgi:hypothetical protein